MLAYPILISVFLVKNHKNLDSSAFRKKYQNFYKDIAVVNRGRRTVFHYPSFLAMRWMIVIVIIVMGTDSALQMFALLNILKGNIIFYGWIEPHTSIERTQLEYFNNFMLIILGYSMISMTYFNLDSDLVFKMSYVFVIQFAVLVVGNISYIFN